LKCPECGKISSRLETFYSLTCQVKGFSSLEDSIANNIAGSDIEGYRCSFCNKSVNIRKSALLGEMPNTLIVHLQRIEFNFSMGELDKINSYLEFPQHLDLAKYSYKEQMKDSDDIAHPELMEVADDDYIYRLVGVNIHTGTATGGHYYSHINTKRGSLEPDATKGEKEFDEWKKSKDDPWKTFNDDKVSGFTWSSLKTEAYGQEAAKEGGVASSDAMTEAQFQAFLAGTATGGATKAYGKSAYLLIYERKSKKNLTEYHVQEGSEEKKEVEIDFRSVQKYVPQKI
jgi:ubiquitin carboxyl-terminal hydrolase 34